MVVLQVALNRIAQSYPAIPKIPAADGIFGPRTEATVRAFQRIFGLTADGIVGPATWYAVVRLYTAVTRLAELRSQGQQFYAINWSPPNTLQVGNSGDKVRQLQYMLAVLSSYISGIPPVTVDGIFGPATRAAVLASQRRFALPETGVVDARTWDAIYDQYSGIENTTLRSRETFPENRAGTQGAAQAGNFRNGRPSPNGIPAYSRTTTLTQFPGFDLRMGLQDNVSQEVVR